MTAILILITLTMTALLLWARYPLRGRFTAAVYFLCFAAGLILAGAASLAVLTLDTWTSWHLGMAATAANIALTAGAAADLCLGTVRIFRRKAPAFPFRYNVLLTVFLCAALLTFGTVNEKVSVARSCRVTSDRLSREYTVAFLSDIHYGDPSEPEKLSADVAMINAAAPDLVILGGDITDDFSSKEEMEEAYAILSGLRGNTFFIFGNHDRQPHADLADGARYTEEELIRTIEGSGITVLRDRAVRVGDDLILAGREDASRAEGRQAFRDIPGTDTDAFLLVADHSPYETDDLPDSGAILQLSGHSHAGQLFPNRLLMQLAGYRVYGDYKIGEAKLTVSSGEGVWHTPLRTEGRSEILFVTLAPED